MSEAIPTQSFQRSQMVSSSTAPTGPARVDIFLQALVRDGLIEAASVDDDNVRYLGSMLDEEGFDRDEARDTFFGFIPELEDHPERLAALFDCLPEEHKEALAPKLLDEAIVIAQRQSASKSTKKKPARVSQKDKRRSKRAAKIKQRTGAGSGSGGSDSSGESGDDAAPQLPETVGRRELEGDATVLAQKEALRQVYRERMSRSQRMAVSRHHRSGRKNDLMDKHELIAEVMADKEDEIVYTTPSRFKRHFAGDSKYINVTDLTLCCGDLELLSSADLKLAPGHRYGLVGKNGCGKSTLLKRIASGNVQNFPAYMTTMYIEQEIVGGEQSALECVLSAHKDRTSLLEEEAILLQMPSKAMLDFDCNRGSWKAVDARLVELYEEMEVLQMDEAEAKAYAALEKLDFTQEMIEQPTRLLSGGWRMKVALAQAVFMQPDVLLLDEPTNHLDLHGVMWLEQHIASGAHNASSLIVVSHDEAFLNSATTETIIFAGKTLTYYEGNYSQFMRVAQEKAQKQRHLYEVQERQKKHIQESIQKAKKTAKSKKLGDKGNQGGMISSRTKALGRLGQQKTEDGKHWKWSLMGDRQEVQEVKAPQDFKFKFPPVERLRYQGPLLQLDNVTFSYDGAKGKPVLSDVSLDVTAGTKIAVVGKNGAGKSTLMGLIRGTLQPTSGGEVFRHNALKVAFYTQHHVEQLNLDLSPVEHIKKAFPEEDLSETTVRSQLGKYGITGRTALQRMETLSGGQRSRVVFATVTWGQPQVLLLDEPTNHLDFESIRALSEALQEFAGAVVLISHNQALVQAVAPGNILMVSRGRVKKFPGTFEEYRARVQKAVKY